MVAKGDDEKPTTVPKLMLESDEQVRRFIEAMRMKEIKNKVREEMNDARSKIELKRAVEILRTERCILNL